MQSKTPASTTGIKLAIVGSRSITDYRILDCYGLGALAMKGIMPYNISHVVTGGAIGVDKLAEKFIKTYPIFKIEPLIYKPDYKKYGRYEAPKIRNTKIVKTCDAGLVIWDGVSGGTRDTWFKLQDAGKPFILIQCLIFEKPVEEILVRKICFFGNWEEMYEKKIHTPRNSRKSRAAK